MPEECCKDKRDADAIIYAQYKIAILSEQKINKYHYRQW